jgi:hypothetical protein
VTAEIDIKKYSSPRVFQLPYSIFENGLIFPISA